ncbi:MAG TPA: hypothetical protein VF173_31815 [Thermoanaerobaculia bacterium]|nr:hypothetical protein [Thermoanaerobaculia bacterium]
MKRIATPLPLLLLALSAWPAAPAHAALCTLDNVPAATLLLPYFEVDTADPGGRTTLLAINNASAKATLAHVVLWTDLGVPTLNFDVYLTGYDVQTINLRDVFQGHLPRTADVARDPVDAISRKGVLSQDVTFPGCEGLPPEVIPASLRDHLRLAHSGQASPVFGGQCAGVSYGEPQIARGYVTIDVVKACTPLRPGDQGYFGADGVAGFDNVLWGDFIQVDPAGLLAQGANLVRLEADPARFGPGSVTFYGRYVNGSGADGREPLATAWATRYLDGGTFDGGTQIVAWRSPTWPGVPFPCNSHPAGFPRSQAGIVVFDEEEHIATTQTFPFPEQPPIPLLIPFPAAASRVQAGGAALPLPFVFGWLSLDLRPWVNEPADPLAQAWIGQVSNANRRFSVGFAGTQLGSLCAAGRCFQGSDTAVGELCVQGPLVAGEPARFTVAPKGCFSTSCTTVRQAGCAVQDDSTNLRLSLDALVCLDVSQAGPCTPDCSGGGQAQCASGPLAAGTYIAHLGALSLTFQVPSDVGACTGSRN